MIRGRVLGEVWATKAIPFLKGQKILLVGIYEKGEGDSLELNGRVVVALDTLMARTNQDVMVSFGSGARNVFLPDAENRHIPVDASISMIIETPEGRL